jgi:predicted DNA-binding transcriptional regulator AlpA
MSDERSDSELIKIDELAEWFGWAVPTAYREYKRIGVPFLKIAGSLRFRVGAVRAWLEGRERTDTGNAA